jgi:hypothetical protein
MKSRIKAANVIGGPFIAIGTMRCAVCNTVEDELHLLRHMPVMIRNKVTLITVCTGECAQKVEMMPKIESVESLREVNEDG